MKNIILGIIIGLVIAGIIVYLYLYKPNIWRPYIDKNITTQYDKNDTKQRLNHRLANIDDFVVYPSKITLIAIKNERKLELWGYTKERWHHIHDYDFTAFSGVLGPKLKEGDKQIPEGIYSISYLNPNSNYHLSMKLNYPNEFDKKMAISDNRDNLGSDIMIHGKDRSIGCIPVGDKNIEELYMLVSKVGMSNVQVIISPIDFRIQKQSPLKNNKIKWIDTLYDNIEKSLQEFSG